ncbi:MoaD/ThiS family protein [uncultured Zoogloea sp.]|jgi:sulfur carrier protein ThiS|uniref:MoaD/ThiS family protein n=1 Tax=uncultured Zoogloea sp. TaxID=160237 RepID=UPI00262A10BE|nr:MoaD/ThiS family protein [uncultured Zoogloea sp.]
MRVVFKLFASLADYLPADRRGNIVELDVAPGSTVGDLITQYRVPEKSAHLVLVNGHYIPPAARAGRVLAEGDELAIWPPIAGG